MLPVFINLKRHLAFEDATVDLDSLGLAGIAGANGIGKSTSIEAIPYALYGVGRYDEGDRRRPEALIRDGAQDMSVTLEFLAGGERYRIVRGYTRKRKHLLEFCQWTGAAWHPLTGGSVEATEETIESVVRMDSKLFLTTCFLRQGEAGRFAAMGGGGRRKMLADTLELDLYPVLSAEARAKANALEPLLRANRERLRTLDEVPLAIDATESALKDIGITRAEVASALSEAQEALGVAEARHREREAARERLRDLQGQLSRVVEEHRAALDSLQERSAGARVRREKEVREAQGAVLAALLERGKAAAAEVERGVSRADALQKQRTDLNVRLAAIATVDPEEVPQLEAEVAEHDRKRALHLAIVDEQKALLEVIRGLKQRHNLALIDARNSLQQAKARAGKLEEEINCIDLPRAGCRFLPDAQDAARELPALKEALAELEWVTPADKDEERYEFFEAQLNELAYSERLHDEAKRSLGMAQVNAARAAQRDTLAEQLAQVEAEAAEVEASLPALKAARQALQDEYRVAAREQSAALNAAMAAITAEETEEQERLGKAYGDRRTVLEVDIAALKAEPCGPLPVELDNLRHRIADHQAHLSRLDRDAGATEARLDSLRAQLAEGDTLRAQVEAMAEDQGYWQVLAQVLGDKGVPVELMRTAIPELETRTNEILARLTGGNMSIAILTERAKAKGDGEKSVLDVQVRCAGWERAYEGLSGGQRLRVDLALRVALSHLLAGRRGAQLQMLVLDEPTSALDSAGRDAFLECLQVLREDFPLILVISHEADVCSRLPALLKVESDGLGAGARIVRAA